MRELVRLPHRQKVTGKISSMVNASVHADEVLQSGFLLHVGVVQAGVQHDDGEGQNITRVCEENTTKHTGSRHQSLCTNILFDNLSYQH